MTERRRMTAQVIVDKGGDEVAAVAVARMTTQGRALPGSAAGGLRPDSR